MSVISKDYVKQEFKDIKWAIHLKMILLNFLEKIGISAIIQMYAKNSSLISESSRTRVGQNIYICSKEIKKN